MLALKFKLDCNSVAHGTATALFAASETLFMFFLAGKPFLAYNLKTKMPRDLKLCLVCAPIITYYLIFKTKL